ncbi:hypothetical protein Ac2012v2_006610 [Leucoagaricus gongylophorus]
MPQLPVELLSRIFVLYSLPGYTKSAGLLSQLLTRIRLVNRVWNEVAISTPSLWVQIKIDDYRLIPPGILSIWLGRSRIYPLRIELLVYYLESKHSKLLSVLGSSVTRLESLVLHAGKGSVDLVPQHIPISCAVRLKFLCVNAPLRDVSPVISAFVGTTLNLRSLCITLCDVPHRTLTHSLVENLSHLRICGPGYNSKSMWTILGHFRGTFLDLSFIHRPYDEPRLTFMNLKILCLRAAWEDCVHTILSLFDTPRLQVLDLHFGYWREMIYAEALLEYLSRSEYSLQALRIWRLQSVDGLDRFFQAPAIQAIPLVEIGLANEFTAQGLKEERGRALGGAVRVEHWLLGQFVGWNRLFDVPPDLASYLSGENPLSLCCGRKNPFKSVVFEEMKRVDSDRRCGFELITVYQPWYGKFI